MISYMIYLQYDIIFVFCAYCYITDCYIAILAFVTVLPLTLPAYQSAVDDKDAYHGNDSI